MGWADAHLQGYLSSIGKGAGDGPLEQRPLTILTALFRAWGALRLEELEGWVKKLHERPCRERGLWRRLGGASVNRRFLTTLHLKTGEDWIRILRPLSVAGFAIRKCQMGWSDTRLLPVTECSPSSQ